MDIYINKSFTSDNIKIFSDKDFFLKNQFCFETKENEIIFNCLLVNKMIFDLVQDERINIFLCELFYQNKNFINTKNDFSLNDSQNINPYINLKINNETSSFTLSHPFYYTVNGKDYLIETSYDYLAMVNETFKPTKLALLEETVFNYSQITPCSLLYQSTFGIKYEIFENSELFSASSNLLTKEEISNLKLQLFDKHFNAIDFLGAFYYEPLLLRKITGSKNETIRISKKI